MSLGAGVAAAQEVATPTEASTEAPAPPSAADATRRLLAPILGPHGADPVPRERRSDDVDAWGDARARVAAATDPPLDDLGTPSGRTAWVTSRLIAGVDGHIGNRTTLELEVEAVNGQWTGATDVGTAYVDDVFRVRRADARDLRWVLPRKLGVRVDAPQWGQVRVGAQTFTWGTGMLANDGAGDPDFGDPNTGSVLARAAVVATPWQRRGSAPNALRGLAFFAAADFVVRDDNASILEGDLAGAAVAGVRHLTPRTEWGALGVARWQVDRLDPYLPTGERARTFAVPTDVYARVVLTEPTASARWLVETEAAFVAGHTNRSYLDETFEDGAAIRSFGSLARLRFDHDPSRFTAKVEGGVASGDNDPRDDVVRTFSFHTDHNVGLLLFEELLPLISARSLDRVADPALLAVPPPAGRFTVNQGAVSNAVYVAPVVRWRPVSALDLRAGWVTAWTAGDFVDAYQTGVNGGYNATPGGISGGDHLLGHEVDLGAHTTVGLPAATAVLVGVEGATFLPAAAFDGVGGARMPTQNLVRGRLSVRW